MNNDPQTNEPLVKRALAVEPSQLLEARTAPTPTPGWRTTEFWTYLLTIIGIVATSLATAGLPPKWAAACVVVSTAAYGIARGLAKLFTGR